MKSAKATLRLLRAKAELLFCSAVNLMRRIIDSQMNLVYTRYGMFRKQSSKEVKKMCESFEKRDELTTREIARLFEWLKTRGFSAEDAVDCLKYMANEEEA